MVKRKINSDWIRCNYAWQYCSLTSFGTQCITNKHCSEITTITSQSINQSIITPHSQANDKLSKKLCVQCSVAVIRARPSVRYYMRQETDIENRLWKVSHLPCGGSDRRPTESMTSEIKPLWLTVYRTFTEQWDWMIEVRFRVFTRHSRRAAFDVCRPTFIPRHTSTAVESHQQVCIVRVRNVNFIYLFMNSQL